MSGEWSLKELYPSYESKEYRQDVRNYITYMEELSHVQLEDCSDIVHQVIEKLEQATTTFARLSAYSNLRLSTNTTDQESLSQKTQLLGLYAQYAKTRSRLERFLGGITLNPLQDEKLANYQFLLSRYQQMNQYRLSEEVEEVITKLNQSAGSAWEQLQSFLTSTVETTFNQKNYTLSEIRNLAYHPDGAVRKQAYESELQMYESIKEPVAFALNNIKSQVNDLTSLRGFSSPLEATLLESRMTRQTLDALIESIEAALPHFRRYLKHKAHLLGYENGLPFYELFAPVGTENTKTFSVEEMKQYLVTHFSKFSEDLAELTKTVFDNHYVDLFPKKGKVGGAFCHNLPFIEQSRILMNFNGSLRNVITMAHELGHAYHGLHIQEHLPLNRRYTMPVAETASTFNENIIMNTVIQEASPQEKIGLIESLLQDATQIIVDIYSRYLFETEVFNLRKGRFLFSKDLETIMLEAQTKAYGDGLDSNYMHPYMWLCKGHYYSSGLSFYNFPYAFGGLFAKGLYQRYQTEPDGFVDKYQKMLNATTVSTVEETAAIMGIDVTQHAFWQEALNEYVKLIDEFIALTS